VASTPRASERASAAPYPASPFESTSGLAWKVGISAMSRT